MTTHTFKKERQFQNYPIYKDVDHQKKMIRLIKLGEYGIKCYQLNLLKLLMYKFHVLNFLLN